MVFPASPLHTCTRWVSNWIAHLIAVFLLTVDHFGAVSVPCALQPHVEREISRCRFLQGVSLQPPERRKRSNSAENRCFMCKSSFNLFTASDSRWKVRWQPSLPPIRLERVASQQFFHTPCCFEIYQKYSRTFEYEHGNSHWVICYRQSVEWEGCMGGRRGALKASNVWHFWKSLWGIFCWLVSYNKNLQNFVNLKFLHSWFRCRNLIKKYYHTYIVVGAFQWVAYEF